LISLSILKNPPDEEVAFRYIVVKTITGTNHDATLYQALNTSSFIQKVTRDNKKTGKKDINNDPRILINSHLLRHHEVS
jgi:hypothetical protein